MPSSPSQCLPSSLNRLVDFFVAGHVAGQHQIAAEFLCQIGDAILDFLALIGKSQLRAFAFHRLRNAVGDGAVADKAGDQNLFVSQKSHA